MVYGSPLVSDGGRRRTVQLAEERQVIAHDIDRYGRQHEKQADPDPPITMRAFPVRILIMTNTFAGRFSVLVGTALEFIHRCFLESILNRGSGS